MWHAYKISDSSECREFEFYSRSLVDDAHSKSFGLS